MSVSLADPARIAGYHAHVYYDPGTRAAAEALRQVLGERFPVQLGRWHDEKVGPHLKSSYQVAFATAIFPQIVPWLMLNRGGLSILVHPLTGDELADHAQFALWLGPQLGLNLDALRQAEGPAH